MDTNVSGGADSPPHLSEKQLAANIRILLITKGLRWFLVIMPVIVLFFQDNGLSMTQVLLIQAIFSAAVFLFEIPSGYFGDLIGRKASIVTGSVISFLGFLIYSLSYGFWGFLASELILGLGASFISGSDSALLYDSLAAQGRKLEYMKFEGRMISVGNFSEGVASIAGGFLATVSLRTPFWVETIILFLAIPLTLMLAEPERTKVDNSSGNFRTILKIVRFSLHDLPELKWAILFFSFIGASTLNMVWFIQPYLQLAGLPLSFFGAVWAGLQFSVGVFTLLSRRMETLMGTRRTLFVMLVLSVSGYGLLSTYQSLWAIPFILIFYFVRGISVPMSRNYVNGLISSDIRATVLSVKNLTARLAFSLIGPVIGWMHDRYSLSAALGTAGLTFLVCIAVCLFFLIRHDGESGRRGGADAFPQL